MGLNYISLYLAQKLSKSNDVAVIYNQTCCEKRFFEDMDVIIEKVDRNILTKLKDFTEGIDNVVFISMTGKEELNLITAQKIKKMGAIKSAALIYNDDYYNFNYEIDYVLNPLQLIMENIHINLKHTRLYRVINIVPGRLNLALIQLADGDKYSHMKLSKLKNKSSRIMAVKRNNKSFMPASGIRAEPGDLLFILYKPGNSNWHKFITYNRMKSRKIFILGGNRTGHYLADHWEKLFDQIIILEQDYNKCEYLASQLQNPLILHGMATEINLLREEGIDRNSTLIAVNDEDLAALVGSFAARKVSCGRVITVLGKQQSRNTAELMGLKYILTVPELVADKFMKFFKERKNTENYLPGTDILYETFRCRKKLQLMSVPEGLRIGAIFRENQVIIPGKDCYCNQGDNILSFYKRKQKKQVKSFFNREQH